MDVKCTVMLYIFMFSSSAYKRCKIAELFFLFCDLRSLFADRPPSTCHTERRKAEEYFGSVSWCEGGMVVITDIHT